MRQHQFTGQPFARRQRKAALRRQAQEVLHAHCLAHPQQRAVENGVGHGVGGGARAGGQVEAPGLDATRPLAEDEGEVVAVLVAALPIGSGRDEVAFLAEAVVGVLCLEATRHRRHALRVGAAVPQHPAAAIVDGHTCVGHGARAVQRAHPHQAGRPPAFEVHREVRDQRTGARIHGCPLCQQRVAEDARLHLDEVIAALRQRHAQHLGGGGRAARQLRQIGAPHAGLARQQRLVARLVLLLVVLPQACQPAQQFEVGRLGTQAFDGHLAARAGAGQVGLHMAQRQWHQGRLLGVCAALDDAEGGARELRQRRQTARGHRQRKAAGIGQCTAVFVFQAGGQLQLETCVLGQRRGEAHALDERCLFIPLDAGRQRCTATLGHQARGQRQRARHRTAELQTQPAQRQARRLRVFTLTAKLGRETRLHLPLEALFTPRHQRRPPRGGRAADAGTPHQAHFGVSQQRSFTAQQQCVGLGGATLTAPALLAQNGVTGNAIHQHHRQAVEQALHLAPRGAAHAGGIHRAIQAQQEVLVFGDA